MGWLILFVIVVLLVVSFNKSSSKRKIKAANRSSTQSNNRIDKPSTRKKQIVDTEPQISSFVMIDYGSYGDLLKEYTGFEILNIKIKNNSVGLIPVVVDEDGIEIGKLSKNSTSIICTIQNGKNNFAVFHPEKSYKPKPKYASNILVAYFGCEKEGIGKIIQPYRMRKDFFVKHIKLVKRLKCLNDGYNQKKSTAPSELQKEYEKLFYEMYSYNVELEEFTDKFSKKKVMTSYPFNISDFKVRCPANKLSILMKFTNRSKEMVELFDNIDINTLFLTNSDLKKVVKRIEKAKQEL